MFQCSSASRKFLNTYPHRKHTAARSVSVLFSEPKIPQSSGNKCAGRCARVSVLFSEPKIPQSFLDVMRRSTTKCFSALQRAENSSIDTALPLCSATRKVSVLFSEPKIPQWILVQGIGIAANSFSALQRAENSSMLPRSSPRRSGFWVSVLFSEPKIPQWRF